MSNTARIIIRPNEPIGTINPNLHGHFAEHLGGCIDGGVWVGPKSKIPNAGGIRSDVVAALRRIEPPVLRWPGGCFADDYHWEHGVGPAGHRPRTVNMHWGETIEDNGFGTHEFIALCRAIGSEPYFAGNLGSGTVAEMRDWVEYCNFPGGSTRSDQRIANGAAEPFNVKFWGVGNENWGCGGNMCPQDYAVEYKRYATYMHSFGGCPLFLIACGPNTGDKAYHANWTRKCFEKLGGYRRIHGFAAHYYCGTAGTATAYSTDEWLHLLYSASQLEPRIEMHRQIMDEFDPQRKIGLIFDEWGTWHPPTPGKDPRHLWQQNTLRDALVAAMSLDIFNRHADKVVMANIAQMVNVLQALILTDEDRMLLTPTYHVFDMYRRHKGAQSLRTVFDVEPLILASAENTRRLPRVSGSASLRDGVVCVSLINIHPTEPAEVTIDVAGAKLGEVTLTTLHHADITAHNTFESPDTIKPHASPLRLDSGVLTIPPASVNVLHGKPA